MCINKDKKQKITFIGGGGKVTATVIANFFKFDDSCIDKLKIVLYDISIENLNFNKALIEEISIRYGKRIDLDITNDLDVALLDSEIVLYGVNPSRTKEFPFNVCDYFGGIKQLYDFVNKTYSTYLKNKWFFIFSNPVDMLCSSIKKKFPQLNVAGICTGSEEFKQNFSRLIKTSLDDISIDYIATNHHGFILDLKVKGNSYSASSLDDLFEHYNPAKFKGLRKGDEYDLYSNLMLHYCSGVMTIPLGHDPYWHGNDDFSDSAKSVRWRPGRGDFEKIKVSNNFPLATIAEYIDSWGGRYIASILVHLIVNKQEEVNLQLPNSGLIPELPPNIFIEGPVILQRKKFLRKKLDIPWDIRLHIAHSAMYIDKLSEAIINRDTKGIIRALIFKGQKRNYRYSMPKIIKLLKLLEKEKPHKHDIYSDNIFNEINGILNKERDLNFIFI